MQTVSEAKQTSQHQLDQVLEALPTLRRWLVKSASSRGERPPGENPRPASHSRVLIHLYQHGSLTITELARGLGISCSTTTECINALEARGRVAKRRSESDRRQVFVSLTPEAEAVAARVISQRKDIIKHALSRLSPTESHAFIKGLLLLTQGAESWMDEATSPKEIPAKEMELVNA